MKKNSDLKVIGNGEHSVWWKAYSLDKNGSWFTFSYIWVWFLLCYCILIIIGWLCDNLLLAQVRRKNKIKTHIFLFCYNNRQNYSIQIYKTIRNVYLEFSPALCRAVRQRLYIRIGIQSVSQIVDMGGGGGGCLISLFIDIFQINCEW